MTITIPWWIFREGVVFLLGVAVGAFGLYWAANLAILRGLR